MEQNGAQVYDYRQYDRIWQRVAPTLAPYPDMGGSVPEAGAQKAVEIGPETAMQLRAESQLPGAEENPCCMGSAAADILNVLTGFVEEELADRRWLLVLSRQAPAWARQRLREMAADEGNHARRLMAVYYLITGECYHPMVCRDRIQIEKWCPALRERYHAEACGGLNYQRAADGTTDPCLGKLLRELSEDEYHHADILLRMLERTMQGQL